jgi:hypothetical protein
MIGRRSANNSQFKQYLTCAAVGVAEEESALPRSQRSETLNVFGVK